MKSSSSLIIATLLLSVFFEVGVCRERRLLSDDVKEIPIVEGGEQEELARMAIDEHNKKEGTSIEFVRLVAVKEQVVDGKMFYITFEANEADKVKLYEAIVLVIPWQNNLKKVEVFKPVDEESVGAPESNPFNNPADDPNGNPNNDPNAPKDD
ncbi:hypothetical protein OSB04_023784 [Centaurea solstitialis]|uniref:Cysteine proteinase inhibitor n=1 Tax=Centaurea solstitialis TaxID=347529 RepID=A0AA38T3D6_9ASTR|nr:hypothetical protein OSB04_023784 [Centaurea solstitialis]